MARTFRSFVTVGPVLSPPWVTVYDGGPSPPVAVPMTRMLMGAGL